MVTLPQEPLEWDENWYVRRYSDIAEAVKQGRLTDPLKHYREHGFREGRFPTRAAEERAKLARNDTLSPKVAIGKTLVAVDWPVRGEAEKTFGLRLVNGFFKKYLSGPVILDVGYKGGKADAVPILPQAIGVDIDYPGYDGTRLPFDDGSVDTVFTSHVLEHIENFVEVIRDWYRVLKVGGFIVCIVPHQYLYERKRELPSRWSPEHVRFYTPGKLLQNFEQALQPNTYRVRHLADNDLRYRYDLGPEHHPGGCYEIELVIEKIKPSTWSLI